MQSALDDSLKSYFPFPTMRQSQETVLEQIERAIQKGVKFIILEAPTGFGKSPVAVTVAKYLGQSYLCTATKDLQAQYNRDFPYLRVVKGRNNFECLDANEQAGMNLLDMGDSITAEDGACVIDSGYDCAFKTSNDDYIVTQGDRKHPENEVVELSNHAISMLEGREPCPYYHQKHVAFKSNHIIFNYKYFLALVKASLRNPDAKGLLTRKRLMILDEAHLLEEELKDFHSVNIAVFWLRTFLKGYKIDIQDKETVIYNPMSWIPVLTDIKSRLVEHANELKGSQDNVKTVRKIVQISKYVEKLDELIFSLQEAQSTNWIVSRIERKDNAPHGEIVKATFLPLSVGKYSRDVFKFADTVLMMSATILSREAFCKMVGLREDEVEFIAVGSEFPKNNRPIYCLNTGRVNAQTIESILPLLAKKCDDIMSRYPTVKGIIHTTSYKQLNYIVNNLSEQNRRRILATGENVDREQLIQEHIANSKPTVLISPSFHTGLDLKDEASRFQIIVKVPFPDMTDRWISAKMRNDPQWYIWRTSLNLVQSYGRSVRSKTDYADTYILDSTFTGYYMEQAKKMLPKWFLEAIIA